MCRGGMDPYYAYAPAGNLLEKVVRGRVTKYEYDAAGRMVREGKREYRYGGLDKVTWQGNFY